MGEAESALAYVERVAAGPLRPHVLAAVSLLYLSRGAPGDAKHALALARRATADPGAVGGAAAWASLALGKALLAHGDATGAEAAVRASAILPGPAEVPLRLVWIEALISQGRIADAEAAVVLACARLDALEATLGDDELMRSSWGAIEEHVRLRAHALGLGPAAASGAPPAPGAAVVPVVKRKIE